MTCFNKQIIRPDFQAFAQVDRKFNNNPMYVGLRQTLVLKPNSKLKETLRSFGYNRKLRTHHQFIEDRP